MKITKMKRGPSFLPVLILTILLAMFILPPTDLEKSYAESGAEEPSYTDPIHPSKYELPFTGIVSVPPSGLDLNGDDESLPPTKDYATPDSGTVIWNRDAKSVTLRNAVITCTLTNSWGACLALPDGCTLILEGENIISTDLEGIDGIHGSGALTISGSGSLTINTTSTSMALYASEEITYPGMEIKSPENTVIAPYDPPSYSAMKNDMPVSSLRLGPIDYRVVTTTEDTTVHEDRVVSLREAIASAGSGAVITFSESLYINGKASITLSTALDPYYSDAPTVQVPSGKILEVNLLADFPLDFSYFSDNGLIEINSVLYTTSGIRYGGVVPASGLDLQTNTPTEKTLYSVNEGNTILNTLIWDPTDMTLTMRDTTVTATENNTSVISLPAKSILVVQGENFISSGADQVKGVTCSGQLNFRGDGTLTISTTAEAVSASRNIYLERMEIQKPDNAAIKNTGDGYFIFAGEVKANEVTIKYLAEDPTPGPSDGSESTSVVTTTEDTVDPDDGKVSLREAIAAADSGTSITFSESLYTSTGIDIRLNERLEYADKSLTILGRSNNEGKPLVSLYSSSENILWNSGSGDLTLEGLALGTSGTTNGSLVSLANGKFIASNCSFDYAYNQGASTINTTGNDIIFRGVITIVSSLDMMLGDLGSATLILENAVFTRGTISTNGKALNLSLSGTNSITCSSGILTIQGQGELSGSINASAIRYSSAVPTEITVPLNLHLTLNVVDLRQLFSHISGAGLVTVNAVAYPAEYDTVTEKNTALIDYTLTEVINGSHVGVIIPANGIITGTQLEVIKNKNIVINIDTGKGATWIIDGGNIPLTTPLRDLNLTTNPNAGSIPDAVLATVSGAVSVSQLEIASNGVFGFDAALKLDVGTHNIGRVASLFYYDENNQTLIHEDSSPIDQNGQTSVTINHSSSYAVYISEAGVHLYGSWISDGNQHWRECSCTDVTGRENHTWSTWKILKASGTSTGGSRARSCTVCGYTHTEAVRPTGTPPTGDDTGIGFLSAIALISAAGICLLTLRRHRRA